MRFGRIIKRIAQKQRTKVVGEILREGIRLGKLIENMRITEAAHGLSYEPKEAN